MLIRHRFAIRSIPLALALCLTSIGLDAVHAAEPLWSIERNGSGAPRIGIDATLDDRLVPGARFDVALPDGLVVAGRVTRRLRGDARAPRDLPGEADGMAVIALPGARAARLYFDGDRPVGVTLTDHVRERRHVAAFDGTRSGVLATHALAETLCIGFRSSGIRPFVFDSLPLSFAIGVDQLSSRPGAEHTLYLDFWGGTLKNTFWNDDYAGGADIVYEAFDLDRDPTSTSANEEIEIRRVWAAVSEDFSPFDVNVTTNRLVWLMTPDANRGRIVHTATNDFWPDQGDRGAARLGGFGDPYLYTGFNWLFADPGSPFTSSHEAGHLLGLSHDGYDDGVLVEEYYGGHGDWGPVMGDGLYQTYTQWSKGDYLHADNTESDIAILFAELGIAPDAASPVRSSAKRLTLPHTGDYHINPLALLGDIDWFRFDLVVGGQVELSVSSTALARGGNGLSADLAFDARVEDVAGNIVAEISSTDILPLEPETNRLDVDTWLPAGSYYLRVVAHSPDSDWSTGFDEWGNAGGYRVHVTANSAIKPPGGRRPFEPGDRETVRTATLGSR